MNKLQEIAQSYEKDTLSLIYYNDELIFSGNWIAEGVGNLYEGFKTCLKAADILFAEVSFVAKHEDDSRDIWEDAWNCDSYEEALETLLNEGWSLKQGEID